MLPPRICFQLMLILAAALCTLSPNVVQATNIEWKGTDNQGDPAKEAPKSQKYWDENNIQRPDYAKTDAEIAAERRARGESDSTSPSKVLGLLVLVGGAAAAVYQQQRGGGVGNRLGSSSSTSTSTWSSSAAAEEEKVRARNARLAHFDQSLQLDEKED